MRKRQIRAVSLLRDKIAREDHVRPTTSQGLNFRRLRGPARSGGTAESGDKNNGEGRMQFRFVS